MLIYAVGLFYPGKPINRKPKKRLIFNLLTYSYICMPLISLNIRIRLMYKKSGQPIAAEFGKNYLFCPFFSLLNFAKMSSF